MDGRSPYDFVARLSLALGHAPGMTLFGDFTATAPATQHELVTKLVLARGLFPKDLVEGFCNVQF